MSLYQVNVLVNGRRVTTYEHNGETYFEGRPGTEYELELVNLSNTDCEFVVSIDGMSINDGQPAGRDSRGYIIRSYGNTRIKGWLLNNSEAATFKFGAKGKSYAAQSEQGDVKNTGVIGLQVFPKKYVPPFDWNKLHVNNNFGWSDDVPYNGFPPRQFLSKGIAPTRSLGAQSMGYVDTSLSAGDVPPSFNYCTASASAESFTSSVGTEFGRATKMDTTKVSFERASDTPTTTVVLYYGDSKDLNRLGIQLDWQKPKARETKPNPFPADGYCKPPSGWRG